ncbi:hypothetical protein Dimus_022731, partial [Dionaea muscipula]
MQDLQAQLPRGEGIDSWVLGADQGMRFSGRLVVPSSCREELMKEFHCSSMAVHPANTK